MKTTVVHHSVNFDGYLFLALNAARCNSLTFASKDDYPGDHDALMGFYFDGSQMHGALYEFCREFERFLNRKLHTGNLAIHLAFIPVGRDSLLPKLEEGNLWIRASLPPTISLEEAQGYADRMRKIIRSFPEVQTVISQLGRPDDGTDTTGFFNLEFVVPLKPFATWPPNVDKEKLTRQINAALEWPFPGIDFNFSQYIEDNVEEAASGVKGQNSIKLFGNDLH